MAELTPIPLPLLLRRALLEYEREGKIFDLPKSKFFKGLPGLDLSVDVHGHRASTPLGPAAGPHGQLAQNIVLAWLGGSSVIELKTVQILDELKIPRPCIDAANVGYNVEWSQELPLAYSLREYVAASMLIEILKNVLELGPSDTVFDMSVGYNLEGIRSPRMVSWMERMQDASKQIEQLRREMAGDWSRIRDLPFPTCISDTVSLSTFHGCPAGELEGIVTFLVQEMGVHVCVKLNPTLLGLEETTHLLHDVMGYREIQLHPEAFQNDLQFAEALDLIPRLESIAKAAGKTFSVKFSNTLVVKNHRGVFQDDLMYMSGPPLHVLAMNLIRKFRNAMGRTIPTSFSAGLDSHNIASAVAMNLSPVTTCTDLLRPGGYGRLVNYTGNLGEKMRELGVTRIPDFVVRYAGQGAAAIQHVAQERNLDRDLETRLHHWLKQPGLPLDAVCASVPGLEQDLVDTAGMLNTPWVVEEATANPRYRWERNKGEPRKIGAKLAFYDCIACDKCVPVCPNDANFVYETAAVRRSYANVLVRSDGFRSIPGGQFEVRKLRQFANFADACNDCGNCGIVCPESGGPYIAKPRFFSSIDTYHRNAGDNGFYLTFAANRKTIFGTIAGKSYILILDESKDWAWFSDGEAEVEMRLSASQPLITRLYSAAAWKTHTMDLLPYFQLRLLAEGVADPRHIHFANLGGVH
jgi:putative selenate reductase